VKRTAALMIATASLVGCGGGSQSPTSSTPTSGSATKVVTLESGNFDALVLTPGRPSLVEFHSPT